MRRAIELASGRRTHPNPSVGAVLVSDGQVVGEGFHKGPGHAHAEVVALQEAGERSRGADLYVTLEPCSFTGRTPPCVEAILSSGVRRVFVGIEDPDNRVAGAGVGSLQEGGVEVVLWDSPAEAEAVDPAYFYHRRTGLPRVVYKYAMTLDGSVAAADGSSQWITSQEAREDLHLLRSAVDAVVIGAGTLRVDDPGLNVRLEGYEGHQPRPVVVVGTESLPTGSQIWRREPLVVSPRSLDTPSGEVLVVDGDPYPDPIKTARMLADRGYLDCLLEGGPTLAGAWWNAGVISGGYLYLGARVGGGVGMPPLRGVFETIAKARDVEIVDMRMLGPDVRIEFH